MTAKSRKQQLEEMLREEPNDPELRYAVAMEEVSAGNDGEAVERFRELLAVVPTYAPAYLLAGQTLLRLNRVAEAREVWERGVTVARQQGNAHAADEMQGMLANLD